MVFLYCNCDLLYKDRQIVHPAGNRNTISPFQIGSENIIYSSSFFVQSFEMLVNRNLENKKFKIILKFEIVRHTIDVQWLINM